MTGKRSRVLSCEDWGGAFRGKAKLMARRRQPDHRGRHAVHRTDKDSGTTGELPHCKSSRWRWYLGQLGSSRNIGATNEKAAHSDRPSFEPLIGRSFGLSDRLIAHLISYLFLACYGSVRKTKVTIAPGSQTSGKSRQIMTCCGLDASAAISFPDVFPVIGESRSSQTGLRGLRPPPARHLGL